MNKLSFMGLATAAALLPAQAGAVVTFGGSASGFGIPLGANTQSSTVNISENRAVKDVTFTLSLLAHTAARDLTATVTHNGITANLFSGVSDLRGLLGNYSFSDGASTLLKNGGGLLVINPGTYKITYPGSSFAGSTAGGNWTLSIKDNRFLGAGLLGSWSLSGNAVPEPATWAMMILGLGAVGFAMRRRKETARAAFA